MKKSFKYISILAGAAATAFSCNLDLEPFGYVHVEEGEPIIVTFTDLEDFRYGLLADYRSLHGGIYDIIDDVMTDGFNASADFGNNYGGIHRLDDSYNTGDDYITSYWQGHYVAINDYNVLLDALYDEKNVPEGAKDYARMTQGEAFFFRADAYLNLARRFGVEYDKSTCNTDLCVPIVLHHDLEGRPARNTVAEVYQQIHDDLDSARVLLKDIPGEIRSAYPTEDAVTALRARYYLDIEDYYHADSCATAVINSSAGYALSKTANEMTAEFRQDSGSEPILQMAGSTSELPSSKGLYTNMSSTPDDGVVFGSLFLPSGKLFSLYSPEDLRRDNWFTNTQYPSRISGTIYKGSFYTFIKYMGNPSLYSGRVPNACQMTKPFTISEMYLIAAEARLLDGNAPKAKSVLNSLQQARKADPTAATLVNIKNEWFKEMAGQGQRFVCLKRWHDGFNGREGQSGAVNSNVLSTGDNYTGKVLEKNSHYWNWPIPASEITVNPNLLQNEGYTIDK